MQSKAKRLAFRVLALVLLSAFFCASALADYTAAVNCDRLVVRDGASTSAKKLGTLTYGTKVTVNSTSGSWSRITYKGHSGYAASKYLSKVASEQRFSSRVTMYTTDSVAVYTKASTSSGKLGTLSKGFKVFGVATNGSFTKVENTNGSRTGYILTSKLSRNKPTSTAASKIDRVISLAKAKLGCKYVVGGSGSKTFDCSGLTRYCFSEVGVYLPHSARSQGYSGTRLAKSKLKKGDLVFFDTDPKDGDKCDHVGIYLGSGSFIHASSAAGKVMTSSLSSGYYSNTFSWGRRIL